MFRRFAFDHKSSWLLYLKKLTLIRRSRLEKIGEASATLEILEKRKKEPVRDGKGKRTVHAAA